MYTKQKVSKNLVLLKEKLQYRVFEYAVSSRSNCYKVEKKNLFIQLFTPSQTSPGFYVSAVQII